MIRIEIPGRERVQAEHVVFDYNGTIAVDGRLSDTFKPMFTELSKKVIIHVLTADTYGNVRKECEGLPLMVETFPKAGAALCKEEIVKGLSGGVICIGNGFNDIQMFDASDLSIAVIDREGACAMLLLHADIVVTSMVDAVEMLLKTDRVKATLRS